MAQTGGIYKHQQRVLRRQRLTAQKCCHLTPSSSSTKGSAGLRSAGLTLSFQSVCFQSTHLQLARCSLKHIYSCISLKTSQMNRREETPMPSLSASKTQPDTGSHESPSYKGQSQYLLLAWHVDKAEKKLQPLSAPPPASATQGVSLPPENCPKPPKKSKEEMVWWVDNPALLRSLSKH